MNARALALSLVALCASAPACRAAVPAARLARVLRAVPARYHPEISAFLRRPEAPAQALQSALSEWAPGAPEPDAAASAELAARGALEGLPDEQVFLKLGQLGLALGHRLPDREREELREAARSAGEPLEDWKVSAAVDRLAKLEWEIRRDLENLYLGVTTEGWAALEPPAEPPGFDRAGRSSVFRRGELLVELREDGSVQQVYREDEIPPAAIIKGAHGGPFYIHRFGPRFQLGPEVVDDIDEILAKPAKEHLREAGYRELPGSDGLFRHEKLPGLVLVVGGRVAKVFSPLSSADAALPAGMRIVGSRDTVVFGRNGLRDGRLRLTVFLANNRERWELAPGAVAPILERKIADDLALREPAELGIRALAPSVDERTGFVVAGVNETDAIRRLRTLNGREIERLEADMRPGMSSTAGFLGERDGLLETMAADNDLVRGALRTTHQALALSLMVVRAAFERLHATEIVFRGRRLSLRGTAHIGFQHSPFLDRTSSRLDDITVTDIATGRAMKFAGLVADMAERYGFWEGAGTRYRVDPRDVAAVLGEPPSTHGP